MADTAFTLANWRTAPFNRAAFHRVREIVPSADIPHERRRVRELPAAPAELSALRIDPDAGEPLRFDTFLQETSTDAMVVLHRGRVVFEQALEAPHILMSVSKSMLGLLFGSLGLDPAQRVAAIVPEVKDTAYRDATLRHLLDMRVGIRFNEDYLATTGPIVEYRKATGWNPLAPGDTPSDLHSFYGTLKETEGSHGGPMHYVSPNTDLMGWVIERATGKRYAELMSELVWKRIGAEYPAYITVDRLGAPRVAGGMCATVRDLARVGQFLIENPTPWVEDIEKNGDAGAWSSGDMAPYFPGLPLRYRSYWYVLEGAAPLLFGFGIHGQFLCVDRKNEIVVAKFSSQALPMDTARIGLMMRAVSEIRKLLAP